MRQVELDDGYSVQRLVAMSEAAEDVLPQCSHGSGTAQVREATMASRRERKRPVGSP